MLAASKNDRRAVVILFCVLALMLAVAIVSGCNSGQSRNQCARPKLLVFGSVSCRDCVLDYPVVEQIAEMGMVTIEVVLFDNEPQMFLTHNVKAMPTYILFCGEREVYRTGQAGKMKSYLARQVRK